VQLEERIAALEQRAAAENKPEPLQPVEKP
jgi:hypothetical protein